MKRTRWLYAAAGFGLGLLYSLGALALGLEITLAGRDATLAVAATLELSFAAFGYLLGLAVEARRAEREAARRIEAQLERIQAFQARLAQTEKLAALGQLAGTLAHEVRNPLAIIRSLVQSLAEAHGEETGESGFGKDGGEGPQGEAGGEVAAICLQVLEEIDRLSRVVSSLVGFARPLTLERRAVSPEEILERTELLATKLLRRGTAPMPRLVREPGGPDGARLEADPDLLCQVLLGLLANAAEASPEGGEVRFGWGSRGGEVEIWVTDEGPGIPAELRERIFDPFFTTRREGSGLGLAVARQIVEAHSGRIEVEGGPRGARFRVCLAAGGAARDAA